ncbi:hypothetical protein D3C77_537130 [compost metagenome]
MRPTLQIPGGHPQGNRGTGPIDTTDFDLCPPGTFAHPGVMVVANRTVQAYARMPGAEGRTDDNLQHAQGIKRIEAVRPVLAAQPIHQQGMVKTVEREQHGQACGARCTGDDRDHTLLVIATLQQAGNGAGIAGLQRLVVAAHEQ